MFFTILVCENGRKKQIVVPFVGDNSTWCRFSIGLAVSFPSFFFFRLLMVACPSHLFRPLLRAFFDRTIGLSASNQFVTAEAAGSESRTPGPLVFMQDGIECLLIVFAGAVISEYEVEDKKQVAEFDPRPFLFEDEDEEVRPCPICDRSDQEEVLLLCDQCDAPYHTHCIGLSRVPDGLWFCMECAENGAYARAGLEAERSQTLSRRLAPRTSASARLAREHERNDPWNSTWNLFSTRVQEVVGLDLDFSDDEQSMSSFRSHQQRLDEQRRRAHLEQWERRLEIAERQGAQRNIFRIPAPPQVIAPPQPRTPAETAIETSAWRALERAQRMDTSTPRSRKRKSRSTTASPGSPQEPAEPERKLKRPRTRRVLDRPEGSIPRTSSATQTQRPNGNQTPMSPTSRALGDSNTEPSFLTSLLKELGEGPTSDDDTTKSAVSTSMSNPYRVNSPPLEFSSPAASPASSTSYHTPRASSMTPPPHLSKRPGSPYSLTSRVEPIFPPADYSPSSNRSLPESESELDQESHTPKCSRPMISHLEIRQPRPRRQGPSLSPTSDMPFEAKENVNKIVTKALAPHWQKQQITKDQYTNINRDVSRKLYEIFADLGEQTTTWEKITTTATAEVATAVKSLVV